MACSEEGEGNTGPLYMKKCDFQAEFHKVVNHMLAEEEFETAWDALLDKYNLRGPNYRTQIYETRHKWAKPYLRGVFCAKNDKYTEE